MVNFQSRLPGKPYDLYKTMLGKLTLLEKPINIVASNNFFQTKSAEYKKCKYYLTNSIVERTTVGNNSSINRINAKLQSLTIWDAAAIEKRQELPSDLVSEIWKIEEVEAP